MDHLAATLQTGIEGERIAQKAKRRQQAIAHLQQTRDRSRLWALPILFCIVAPALGILLWPRLVNLKDAPVEVLVQMNTMLVWLAMGIAGGAACYAGLLHRRLRALTTLISQADWSAIESADR